MLQSMLQAENSLQEIRFLLKRTKEKLGLADKPKPVRLVWSKKGWRQEPIPTEEKILYSHRSTQGKDPDPEYSYTISRDLELLGDVEDSIQTKGALAAIDNLPPSLRLLYEYSDVWDIRRRGGKLRLSKIVDPVDQVRIWGEWGIDLTEKEEDRPSVLRQFLEDSGQIDSEEAFEDLPNGITFEGVHRDYNTIVGNSIIPKSINSNAQNFEPPDDILKEIEGKGLKQVERILEPWFTYRLNSPYTNFGYIPPKRRYDYISQDIQSPTVVAAERRKDFFWDLYANISDISNPKEMGVGKYYNTPTSICQQLHNMYDQDKTLVNAWNDKIFFSERNKFIKEQEKTGISERSLQNLTWFTFDAQRATKDIIILKDKETKIIARTKKGKEVTSKITEGRDSLWQIDKTKAFEDLHLTKSQWHLIYQLLKIKKDKLRLTKYSVLQEDTLKLLRKYFRQIETLRELKLYRAWISKRIILPEEIKPSKLDKISVENEHKIAMACVKLEKKLWKEEQNET